MGKSNNINNNNNNNNNEYEYDGDNSGWRRKDRRQRRGSRSQQQSQQQTSYHHNHNHNHHNHHNHPHHHHHRPVRKKLLLLFDPIAVCVLLGSLGILLLQFATFSVLNQSLEDSGKSSWLTTLSIVSIDDINNDGLQRRQHGRIERSLVDTDTDTDTDTDDANDEDDGDGSGSGSGSGSGDHDETETDTKPKQQQQQKRQHYPPLLHHNYNNNNKNNNGVGIIPKQPMLVVGGSDGSGTRAVVALLRELGCIVVADDRSTFDVHLEAIASVQNGHETRGWPSLVERVFSNFGRDGVFQRQRHRQREIASKSDGNGNGKNTNASSNTNSKDKNTNTTNNSDYSFNFEWPPRERSRNEAVATSLEKDVRKALRRLTGQFHQEENSRKIAYEKRKQSVDTDTDTDKDTQQQQQQHQQHKYSVHLGNRRGVKEQTVFAGHTEDVAYAIKAPVSMLILPLLASSVASFYRTQHKNATPPTLKFLHVVRDGRDVALSENQSPVHKFYNLTYPKVTDDPHRAGISSFAELLKNKNNNNNNNNKNRTKNTNSTTTTHSNSTTTTTTTTKNNSTTASLEDSVLYGRAMQLWNDWNVKVHEWANDPLRNRRADDHAPAVEYMMVRSEDLLVPNTVERLDALKALASFVGSSLTPEELCVLARRDPKDYGISQVGPGILGGGGGGGKQHPYVNRFGAMARDFKWRPNALRLPRDTTPWKGKPPPPPPPAAPSPPLPLPPPVSDERPKSSQARRRLSSLATSSADHHEDEQKQEQEQDGETKPLTESERIRVTQLEQDYGGWKKMVASVLRQRTVVDSIYDSLLRSGELLLYRCKQLPQRLQQSFFSAKKNHGGEVDPEHWIDMLRYRKERAAKRREKQQNNTNTNTNNDYKQRRGRGRVGRARVKVPLQKRYGKWKAVLDGNPELSEFFYRAGAEGLEVFGYHPYRPARYDRGNTNGNGNGNGNDTTIGAAQTGTYLCPMNSTHGSSDGAQ